MKRLLIPMDNQRTNFIRKIKADYNLLNGIEDKLDYIEYQLSDYEKLMFASELLPYLYDKHNYRYQLHQGLSERTMWLINCRVPTMSYGDHDILRNRRVDVEFDENLKELGINEDDEELFEEIVTLNDSKYRAQSELYYNALPNEIVDGTTITVVSEEEKLESTYKYYPIYKTIMDKLLFYSTKKINEASKISDFKYPIQGELIVEPIINTDYIDKNDIIDSNYFTIKTQEAFNTLDDYQTIDNVRVFYNESGFKIPNFRLCLYNSGSYVQSGISNHSLIEHLMSVGDVRMITATHQDNSHIRFYSGNVDIENIIAFSTKSIFEIQEQLTQEEMEVLLKGRYPSRTLIKDVYDKLGIKFINVDTYC